MTTYLLDANVLIALTVAEHEHHDRAARWVSGVSSFAVCPIVEGALARFFIRTGETEATASVVLRGIQERPGYQFWPDALSYVHVDLSGVVGHRQVTDAYLVALALSHEGALLAAMDEGLAAVFHEGTFLLRSIVSGTI